MAITPLPTPVPSTSDPANFDTRADAFLGALPTFATEANALAVQMNSDAEDVAEAVTDIQASALVAAEAAGLVAQSTSLLSVLAGSKTITFSSAKPLLAEVNKRVVILLKSDPTIRMFATVATVTDSSHITATVVSGGVFGSGTYSSWEIIDAAFFGAAATAADILAATSDVASITPKAQKDALARFTLTDGSPVTGLSGLNGLDFFWTLTANRTLPQLTNTYPGARGTITAKQDATGSRILAVHSSYKRRGGLGVLSTAAAAEDEIPYEVKTVDGSGNATRTIYDVIKAPS